LVGVGIGRGFDVFLKTLSPILLKMKPTLVDSGKNINIVIGGSLGAEVKNSKIKRLKNKENVFV